MSRRKIADEQIRDRFTTMRGQFRTKRLHLISAIGTRCYVYTYNHTLGTVTPGQILQHDPDDETENLAPATNWNIDISTLEGRQALLEYFNDVKAMCDELLLSLKNPE
ncbi:MAG: hypothetical protein JOS17DRAFT_764877 [Linnemannia elongata]|nr:MAG: hypothetical protein JOS17DRAFT_764877 [Linnemannia elongata]